MMCGECRSNAGRSDRIRGIEVKLCRGGGQDVTHSSEFAYPHGSSAVSRCPCRDVMYTFQRKKRVDAPSRKEPTEEPWLSVVTLSGTSGRAPRRGIPWRPAHLAKSSCTPRRESSP